MNDLTCVEKYQYKGEFQGLMLRKYSNGVEILYKKHIRQRKIDISWVMAEVPHQGHGTEAIKHFLNDFYKYTIILSSTKEIINWYKSLGFIERYEDGYRNHELIKYPVVKAVEI